MDFLSDNNIWVFKSKARKANHSIYICLLALIITTLASLPFIKWTIVIKTAGITRPQNERTEVRPVISGIIDTLYYKEGDEIQKDAVILRIRDLNTKSKRIRNQFEINQRKDFVHDLLLLTSTPQFENAAPQIQSAVYTEQLNHFLQQKTEQEILLKKADKEVEINTPLAKEKVISPKEYFDIRNNQEKIQASCKAFIKGQLSTWQQDLARYQLELAQFAEQLNEVNTNAGYYEVKAPVTGIIQGIHTRYAGGLLQANEPICSISPEGSIIGECMVQTKDVGLLHKGQPVRCQIEAFDYNYFGVLTGKILSIDNDFTPIDNKPLFKVRCSFDSTKMHLKNGYTGQIKKGLGFQASFIIARRSLWQLLFDKLDNWLNPNAPPINMTATL